MLELFFVSIVGIGTLAFVLLLFSLFGKPQGDDVRARMEQYLVESEMAARAYVPPVADDGDDGEDPPEESPSMADGDDEWLRETRAGTGGVKKVLFQFGSLITPKGQAVRIAETMAKAGIPLKANEFMAIKFLSAVLLFFLLSLQSPSLGVLGAILGFFLPDIFAGIKKAQRLAAFNDQILDTLIMLSNGLKAGYSFLQAMEMVSREAPAPMSTELRRVLKENSFGLNLEDALRNLNSRIESEDWDLVTTVVLIQRQVGGNLAEILDKIGFTIRQRMRIKGDIRTKTAQAKVSGLLVGALPFFIGFMVYLLNPAFIMKLFTFRMGAFRGWYVVIAGLLWEAIGLYIIMKIVDIEV